MSEKARLIQAFEWNCPSCGSINFVSAIKQDMGPEDTAELLQSMGLDNTLEEDDVEASFEYVRIPEEVECHVCGDQFEAVIDGAEDDLDFDFDEPDEDDSWS